MTARPDSAKRLAKLEADIARRLFRDLERDGDLFRVVTVLTVVLAKMLCAAAEAEGVADDTLLAAQDDSLRNAVRLIRSRFPAELWPAVARMH